MKFAPEYSKIVHETVMAILNDIYCAVLPISEFPIRHNPISRDYDYTAKLITECINKSKK